MKLIKSQTEKIAKEYNLGEIKKINPIAEGWVNFNFNLETDKGKFIIQVFGRKYDDWLTEKMKLEFEVLNYLKKKKFPYEIPQPIKNSKGNYILKLGKNHLWVYRKIEGRALDNKANPKQFKEIVKAMAIYHKFMRDFEYKNKRNFNNFGWFLKQYSGMKKVKPQNKTDKLMLANIDFFYKLFKENSKVNFVGRWIVVHHDFNKENVIFNGDRLKGIIDFDNVKFAPIMADASILLKKHPSKKNIRIFLREYEKIIKLSKKEKDLIIPLIIRDNCILFWWYYAGMKKHLTERYSSILRLVKRTKELIEKLK